LRSFSRASPVAVAAVPDPPPVAPGVHAVMPEYDRLSAGRNSKERLRTSSAYSPPSAAKLMSSKNTPYMESAIAGPSAREPTVME
jgi:hypothetical protein